VRPPLPAPWREQAATTGEESGNGGGGAAARRGDWSSPVTADRSQEKHEQIQGGAGAAAPPRPASACHPDRLYAMFEPMGRSDTMYELGLHLHSAKSPPSQRLQECVFKASHHHQYQILFFHSKKNPLLPFIKKKGKYFFLKRCNPTKQTSSTKVIHHQHINVSFKINKEPALQKYLNIQLLSD
jgi:hypothetical protein